MDPADSGIPADVKTVAIASLGSRVPRLSSDQVAAVFEGRAVERLEKAGVAVVGTGVWEEVWRRYADDIGGVYDATTGEADEEKYTTVKEAVTRELVEEHGVDAILFLLVAAVENEGVMRDVRACGGTVEVYWPGNWRARQPREQAATLVRSVCLVGSLQDSNGKELFGRQAPIAAIETRAEQTRAMRPSAEFFQDGYMIDNAIEFVLHPFEPLPEDADQPTEEKEEQDPLEGPIDSPADRGDLEPTQVQSTHDEPK